MLASKGENNEDVRFEFGDKRIRRETYQARHDAARPCGGGETIGNPSRFPTRAIIKPVPSTVKNRLAQCQHRAEAAFDQSHYSFSFFVLASCYSSSANGSLLFVLAMISYSAMFAGQRPGR